MKLRFYVSASTRFQIHSPLLFDFCIEVLDNEKYYYGYDQLTELWQNETAHYRKSFPLKHLQFLFRISQWYQANYIVSTSDMSTLPKEALFLGNIYADFIDPTFSNLPHQSYDGYPSTCENIAKMKHLVYASNPFIPSHWAIQLSEIPFLLIIDNIFICNENYDQWKSLRSTFSCPVYTIQTPRFGLIMGAKEILYSENFNLIPLRSKPFKIL
jgi:hypothetical protein